MNDKFERTEEPEDKQKVYEAGYIEVDRPYVINAVMRSLTQDGHIQKILEGGEDPIEPENLLVRVDYNQEFDFEGEDGQQNTMFRVNFFEKSEEEMELEFDDVDSDELSEEPALDE